MRHAVVTEFAGGHDNRAFEYLAADVRGVEVLLQVEAGRNVIDVAGLSTDGDVVLEFQQSLMLVFAGVYGETVVGISDVIPGGRTWMAAADEGRPLEL